jgi:hypothetical protein
MITVNIDYNFFMENQEQNVKDILEVVNFIKDNAASKEDLSLVKLDLDKVKGKIEELPTREDFSKLQESVDSYAHKADIYFQEMAVLNNKVNRHERWIEQMAAKLEMKLEY